jgi:uncharacterized protein YneF (UPF0154 family)
MELVNGFSVIPIWLMALLLGFLLGFFFVAKRYKIKWGVE